MSGRLHSRRFRHRLYWSVGGLGVGAAIVVSAIEIGNTGKSNATPIIDKPAQVYHEPARMHLTQADRRDLFAATTLFLKTAVARKHLDSAWDLLGPEMKAGQTRKSWDTGNNDVIPFPAVGIATWNVLYAYQNDVAIDIGVVGSKKSDWAGKTFTIELKRYTNTNHPRSWLVASWVPKGIGGAGQIRSVAAQPLHKPVKATVSAKWLFAPLGFLGLLLVGLAAWGVSALIKQRRVAKKYEKLLGYSSSSNPS
jgi:hypothetical protein